MPSWSKLVLNPGKAEKTIGNKCESITFHGDVKRNITFEPFEARRLENFASNITATSGLLTFLTIKGFSPLVSPKTCESVR